MVDIHTKSTQKLPCKIFTQTPYLHPDVLHANLPVFLRWLILLVKIHARCMYFFTTANVANAKLETDVVEKYLFTVKEKTTVLPYTFSYYHRAMIANVMFCDQWFPLAVGWRAILLVNLDACYLPRPLFWNKFNVLACVAGARTSVHCLFFSDLFIICA